MSISIRHQMQLDGYQSSNHHHTIYPLTAENVSKVTLADPSSMPLARFCKEIESTAYITSSVTSLHHQQPRGTDNVIESPRILPFPYHNDSYFLPTAEHDYPGYSTTDTSSLSSSRVGSRQFMTSLTSINNRGGLSRLQASRSPSQESYYSNNNNNEKRYTAERSLPSSPIRHYHHSPKNNIKHSISFENWKKEYVKDQKSFMLKLKHRISQIKNNVGSNNSPSSFLKSKKYNKESDQSSIKSTSPWYKKIWNIVSTPQIKRKSSMATLIDEERKDRKDTKKQVPSQFDSGIRRSASLSCTPVWYSQFRCNPPRPPTNTVLLS